MFFYLFCGLALLFAAWLLADPWLARRRRARLRELPFPKDWGRIVRERVPVVAQLPIELQRQLEGHMQVFLAEKPFIGCAGLELTQDMRVVVAAQACLLLLNRDAGCFDDLRQILVYPGPFVVQRTHSDRAGLLQDLRQVLSGESWSQGQVILSWDDVLSGAADPADGRNVVLHEFAHQLDQQGGVANGAPWFGSRARRRRWAMVLGQEFAQLQQRAQSGAPSLISDYGASSPAEFFAVATEVFFEQPARMAAEHGPLYVELQRFYCVDPLSWRPAAPASDASDTGAAVVQESSSG